MKLIHIERVQQMIKNEEVSSSLVKLFVLKFPIFFKRCQIVNEIDQEKRGRSNIQQ